MRRVESIKKTSHTQSGAVVRNCRYGNANTIIRNRIEV